MQPDAIFATEGSGITTLKDLEGKKIATATFSSSNVTWPLIVKANGVDPAKVKLLKVDPGALAPMLAAGQVDATINWSTVAPPFVQAARGDRQEAQGPALVASRLRRLRPFGFRLRQNDRRAAGRRAEIR